MGGPRRKRDGSPSEGAAAGYSTGRAGRGRPRPETGPDTSPVTGLDASPDTGPDASLVARPDASLVTKPDRSPDADPEAVARQICLRMLTAAPRTQAQLAAALRRRGVPEEAATAVLARFAEVKLIDDAMFARAWVDSRHYGRGLSGRALGAELRQRGVARDDIQAALSELSPDVELQTARELIVRRLAGTAGMPFPVRMRRLVGALARKGYGPGLAYRVVREALEAEAGDGPVPAFELEDLGEPGDADETVEV